MKRKNIRMCKATMSHSVFMMGVFLTVFFILTILTVLRKETQIWLRIMLLTSLRARRLDLEHATVEMEIITSLSRPSELDIAWVGRQALGTWEKLGMFSYNIREKCVTNG